MADVVDMATELAEAFETRKRADGTEYTCLGEDAPQWMCDAVMAAHGNELPHDWIYAACADAAREIAHHARIDDSDHAHEWADHCADVYESALARWLADVPGAWEACQKARQEWGAESDDLHGMLRRGQYSMLLGIYQELALAIELEGSEA